MNHFLLGVESTQHFRCVQQLGKQKKMKFSLALIVISACAYYTCGTSINCWNNSRADDGRKRLARKTKREGRKEEMKKKKQKTRNVVKVRVIFHYAHRLTAGERRRGAMNLSLHSPSVKLHFSFFFLLFGLVSLYIYTLASIYAPSFTQPSIPTIFSI